MKKINLKEGQRLINIARKAIEKNLKSEERISNLKVSKNLQRDMGAFVTLRKPEKSEEQDLRGCMGIPLPKKSLVEAVIDSAINSSTRDPRFPKLSLDELEEVIIEVSVLSSPQKVEVEDREELVNEITVGENGLIVESSMSSGLLLPTVPLEHSWDEKEFLDQTCRKAGLQRGCWKNEDVIVKKFSGIVFSEKTPNGEVEQIFGK